MINFDEEIEKFQPSLEIEQAEDVINNNDLTDISDILKELLKQKSDKQNKYKTYTTKKLGGDKSDLPKLRK